MTRKQQGVTEAEAPGAAICVCQMSRDFVVKTQRDVYLLMDKETKKKCSKGRDRVAFCIFWSALRKTFIRTIKDLFE